MLEYLLERINSKYVSGYLTLAGDEYGIRYAGLSREKNAALTALNVLSNEENKHKNLSTQRLAILQDGFKRISDYFEGRDVNLADARLHMIGTDWQKRVWRQLMAIPRGLTLSYEQLAATLDSHPRALGGACAANTLALFIPCHRVVPKSQIRLSDASVQNEEDLPFYPGTYKWGNEYKKQLLLLERAQ